MRPTFPLTVREAIEQDAESLVRLWSTAAERSGRRVAENTLWGLPDVADVAVALAEQTSRGDGGTWVALRDGAVVAAALATMSAAIPMTRTRMLIVTDLIVDPEQRRHGVARRLLHHLAVHAEENGCEVVMAVVPASAREPARYFAKLGFGQVATMRAMSTGALRARTGIGDAASATERMVAVRRTLRRRSVPRS
ncbi:MAG: GNAT family N-acetyltransferase [Aeromicrobium sp.]|uniref:GNAT family N-acetyltransferase n=1 Tax=Aeromicrobium sp. TaxID=1871063 RepID=UPI0039E2E61A